MKLKQITFLSFLLLIFSIVSFAQEKETAQENQLVAGKGLGIVSLNSTQKEIEKVLGKGQEKSKYYDVYFIDYAEKGIQISYNNNDKKAHAIFFYNKQKRYENFATPNIETDKKIDWTSTSEEVIKAYGKPEDQFKDDNGGSEWQRIVYEGIDFRFENNKMVRIGITEN